MCYGTIYPPSTLRIVPVVKLFFSSAKNKIDLATSIGSPMRFIGCVDAKLFSVYVPLLNASLNISVFIAPGATALILIFSSA